MSAAQPSALIIAGGRGTRFWPESRAWRPKPLFSIDGRTSLLADTVARLAPVTGNDRTFVLVSGDQHAIFRKALRGLIPPRNLIVEPSARGTAVAIAYGCATIAHRVGDGVVAVMPADHYIRPPTAFRRTLGDAIKLATTHRAIVVIGIAPGSGSTGDGQVPAGGTVLPNTAGQPEYKGPCPPAGTGTHHYRFTLYQLPNTYELPGGLAGVQAAQTIAGAATAQAQLTGTFGG